MTPFVYQASALRVVFGAGCLALNLREGKPRCQVESYRSAAAISGAPCTSLTTSPLAVRGAVSTALDGIWIEVFTIFLSTEIKPKTPATRMQPLVGSD